MGGRHRQAAQEESVEQRKDGRVGSNCQRECEDRRQTEDRRLPQSTNAEHEIAKPAFQNRGEFLIPHLLYHHLRAAELEMRAAASFSGGPACRKMVFHQHFHMDAELVLQVGVTPEVADAFPQPAEPILHRVLLHFLTGHVPSPGMMSRIRIALNECLQ